MRKHPQHPKLDLLGGSACAMANMEEAGEVGDPALKIAGPWIVGAAVCVLVQLSGDSPNAFGSVDAMKLPFLEPAGGYGRPLRRIASSVRWVDSVIVTQCGGV